MSLTINLSADDERKLAAAAIKRGMAPDQMAADIVRSHLPEDGAIAEMTRRMEQWRLDDSTVATLPMAIPSGESPTAALFAEWEKADRAMTEEEAEDDDRLWREFRVGIDEARNARGMRTLFHDPGSPTR